MQEDVANAISFVAVGAGRIRRGVGSDGVFLEGLEVLRSKHSRHPDHDFIVEQLRDIQAGDATDVVGRAIQEVLDEIVR